MNCALCNAAIDIDPADDMQPPDGKSYCGKCAPLVRPGMYAVPGNVCHKALELLWSFKELPPHVRDRLVLCFGPQTWNDIRKTTESSYLLCNEEWLADPANRPPGSVGRFAGAWCFEVFDYGPGALFVRLGPPPTQNKVPA